MCRHITARSRSGLNFLPRSCYGFTTERDLIVNEIGLYFLLAQASGFHTICHYQVFYVPYCNEQPRGARWLSGRVSDSGARGRGFDTYRRRVVSLSKTLYSPKVLVNYPGSGGSVPT